MNAQDHIGMRDKNESIRISDKLTIYQEEKEKQDNIVPKIYWKLFLKKDGEKEVKLLDELEEASAGEIENIMYIPRLIDAYKEKQWIYVFLYKNRSAMLQIYDFKDGIDLKKHEYPLIPVGFGSVMNFGGYQMYVYRKMIGTTCFSNVYLERSGGKQELLMIRENEVYQLEFKDNEKTKRIISAITSREREYLQKEIKTKLIEQGILSKQDQFVYLGYLDDFAEYDFKGAGSTYFFYKDDLNPFIIKVIKYDNGEKEWTINGYTEKRLFSTQEAERWGIEK